MGASKMNLYIKQYKKLVIFIVILCVIIYGIFYFMIPKNSVNKPIVESSVLVSTQVVNRVALVRHLSAMGTIKSTDEVVLTAEAKGVIESIQFQSGDFVKADALLITLKHDAEKAVLAKAQAEFDQAQDQFQRAKKLYMNRMIAQADIVQLKAKLKIASANIDQAKIALAHCFVRAPFAGKLGIMQMSVGQYVEPGDKIIKLESMPVKWVDFSISETVASELNNSAQIAVYPENSQQKISAKIIAIDSGVDLNTRSVNVRAKLESDVWALIPGSFAKITLIIPSQKMGVVIPSTAVHYEPYGASVYMVDQGRAKLRYIKTKPYEGNQMWVSSGLKAGDVIILLGLDKLRDGQQVKIQ